MYRSRAEQALDQTLASADAFPYMVAAVVLWCSLHRLARGTNSSQTPTCSEPKMPSIFQLKIFRAIAGGVWVNFNGVWRDVKEIRVDEYDAETLVLESVPDVSVLVPRKHPSVFELEFYED